jgi:hypothetical protein
MAPLPRRLRHLFVEKRMPIVRERAIVEIAESPGSRRDAGAGGLGRIA